jgi:hypothetical protein
VPNLVGSLLAKFTNEVFILTQVTEHTFSELATDLTKSSVKASTLECVTGALILEVLVLQVVKATISSVATGESARWPSE